MDLLTLIKDQNDAFGVPIDKLERILEEKFPDEASSSLARALSLALEKGRISYEEIESIGCSLEELLLAFKERLLIPARTSQVSRTLAWEDRILAPKKGETYEMPNVIRYLLSYAEKTGKWDPALAVKKYFEEMGDPEADKMVKLFLGLKKRVIKSRNNKIKPEDLKEISGKLELNLDTDSTIAKLKGAGVISPCLRGFMKYGIRYEVNPSLLK